MSKEKRQVINSSVQDFNANIKRIAVSIAEKSDLSKDTLNAVLYLDDVGLLQGMDLWLQEAEDKKKIQKYIF